MSTTTNNTELVIGLVSVSDRASAGVYTDEGIPALSGWLAAALTSPFRIESRLIPDERDDIESTLLELVDERHCHLVLTTGGTGPARRDVTPEATIAVGTRDMPGFGEQMRQISLRFVPTAILSRQVAVIREIGEHAALIMNLPGVLADFADDPARPAESHQGDARRTEGRRRRGHRGRYLRGRALLRRPDRRPVHRNE